MLLTPFGNIIVELNGKPCEYTYKSLPNELMGSQGFLMFRVEARYVVIPQIDAAVNFPLKIKCRVDADLIFDDASECEGGERYSAASMYHNGIKLCIGSNDEIDWVLKDKGDYCDIVDGGFILNEYTTTSIEVFVREKKYLKYIPFGIAWTTLSGDDYENNGSNDVWFAAEPSVIGCTEYE